MPERPRFIVAVIGESDCSADLYALAEEVGKLLAQRGAAVVCGGLGGVMEAACKGATAAGGMSIGLLPGASPADANPHVTVPIATGLGEGRNLLIVRCADAVIAVGGKFGTLSEMALALKLGKPLVGLRTWELHRDGRLVDAFPVVATPTEAVALALNRVSGLAQPKA